MSNASQIRDFRMRLKSARQGAGFTPGDLADELEACGRAVDVDTVTNWENGKGAPREYERAAVEATEVILGCDGELTEALGWPPNP